VTGRYENSAVGNNFWIRSDAVTEEQTMKNVEAVETEFRLSNDRRKIARPLLERNSLII